MFSCLHSFECIVPCNRKYTLVSSTVQKIKILTNPCCYNKLISKKSLVGKITVSRLHLYEDTTLRTSGHSLILTCHEGLRHLFLKILSLCSVTIDTVWRIHSAINWNLWDYERRKAVPPQIWLFYELFCHSAEKNDYSISLRILVI